MKIKTIINHSVFKVLACHCLLFYSVGQKEHWWFVRFLFAASHCLCSVRCRYRCITKFFSGFVLTSRFVWLEKCICFFMQPNTMSKQHTSSNYPPSFKYSQPCAIWWFQTEKITIEYHSSKSNIPNWIMNFRRLWRFFEYPQTPKELFFSQRWTWYPKPVHIVSD